MTVEINQVWHDNDKRAVGRAIRVEEIVGEYALCRVIRDGEPRADRARPVDWTNVGRQTQIRLSTFLTSKYSLEQLA